MQMDARKKNIVYTLVLVGLVAIVYLFRNYGQEPMISYSGQTMGPIIYNVKYFDEEKRNFKPETDSLLKQFNQSLNTYIENSEISTFNRDSTFTFDLPYFYEVLVASKHIHEITDGAFDPTVMPFTNAWGFGPAEPVIPDSAYIDSLRDFTGFEKVIFNSRTVSKTDPRLSLDFSASAKGYGVDIIIEFLAAKGIENAFVEIGGEVRVLGKNINNDSPWRIGILDPSSTESEQFYIAMVELENKALATSGNYFNYRVVDGIRYSHTLNPATGYPAISAILSASIFADNCMDADALATACMVMGHEKAIAFLNENPQYDAFLIFDTGRDQVSTYATEGIRDAVKLRSEKE